MKKTSSILKRYARERLAGNYTLPVVATFLTTMITGIILLPFNLVYRLSPTESNLLFYNAATLIVSLLSALLSCGFLRIHFKIARNEKAQLKDLFYFITQRPDRILLGGLLVMAISIVAILPGGLILGFGVALSHTSLTAVGTLLLLIGLIVAIPVSLSLNLIFLIFADDPDCGVIEACKRSAALMKGNKWRYVCLMFSFLGWEFLSLFSCGFLTYWLTPYINQATVTFYQDLTGELDAPKEEDVDEDVEF